MFAPVMRIMREVKRCVGGGGLWKYWENISLRTDIMGGVFGGDGSDISACGICGVDWHLDGLLSGAIRGMEAVCRPFWSVLVGQDWKECSQPRESEAGP